MCFIKHTIYNMKNKKIKIYILLPLLLFATTMTTTAADETEDIPVTIWTDEPSERAIELMNEARQDPVYEYPEMYSDIVDGYLREYGNMVLTTSEVKNTYNFIGQVSYHNAGSSNNTLQYRQSSTTTTNWDVSSTVKGSADVKLAFLGEIKAELGLTVGASYTTSASNEALATLSIRPGKTGYIDAYHKAVYAVGSIPYWDYTPNTAEVVRSGNINVNGYTIVQNSIHFDGYER